MTLKPPAIMPSDEHKIEYVVEFQDRIVNGEAVEARFFPTFYLAFIFAQSVMENVGFWTMISTIRDRRKKVAVRF